MDLPFIAFTTSPGFVALPEGMFSHKGIMATMLTGNCILQIPYKAPATVAAPPMSPFIKAMLAEGLSEMPPESNVIPFPTRP